MNHWSYFPIVPGCWVESIFGDLGEVQKVDGDLYVTRITENARLYYFTRDEIFCTHESVRGNY